MGRWGAALSTLAVCWSAAARAATPCDIGVALPAAVSALSARLSGGDRLAWATLAQDAEALVPEAPTAAARACLHYVAGSAHFFLSRADRGHAADAVRHFLPAEALAPRAMRSTQAANRFRNAWRRVGSAPGWLDAPGPVRVDLPAAARVDRLVLQPASAEAWAAVCGSTPACAAAVRVVVPFGPAPLSLSLRPGEWRATLEGPCGARTFGLTVPRGGGPLSVPAAPRCALTLLVRDAEGPVSNFEIRGAAGPIAPAALRADAGTVRVSAPGYEPVTLELPPGGGELPVTLRRCRVPLEITAVPPAAEIGEAGPAPWGPRVVWARHPDLGRVERTVRVPRPARCDGTPFAVTLRFPRPVSVVAMDPRGEAVSLARLVVQGRPVDPLSFSAPPGGYSFQATHPTLGMRIGRFSVAPCPAEGACPPAHLEVRFRGRPSQRRRGASAGSYLTLGVGGVVFAGGLAAGAAAHNTQREIDSYGSKRGEGRPLDGLITSRDDSARVADTLLLSGAVVAAAGLAWWWWSR